MVSFGIVTCLVSSRMKIRINKGNGYDEIPCGEVLMKRALLVIDVQNDYFTGMLPITHPVGHLGKIWRSWTPAPGGYRRSSSSTGCSRKTSHSSRRGNPDGSCIPKSRAGLETCGSEIGLLPPVRTYSRKVESRLVYGGPCDLGIAVANHRAHLAPDALARFKQLQLTDRFRRQAIPSEHPALAGSSLAIG